MEPNSAVKCHTRRLNKIAGWVGIFLSLSLGYYLKLKLKIDPIWAQEMLNRFPRNLLRAVHVHGLGLSFINLFYAFFIETAKLSEGWKCWGSRLMVAGLILVPGSLLAYLFTRELWLLGHIGAILTVIAVLIVTVGQIRR